MLAPVPVKCAVAVACCLALSLGAGWPPTGASGQVTAPDQTSRTLIADGDRERTGGRYAQALELYAAARAAAERDADPAAQSAALNGIARVHIGRGAYDLALDSVRQSLALSPESGRSTEAAGALLAQGNVHLQRSEYAPALDCFQRALAIEEPLGDAARVAAALTAIGIVYRQQGRFDEAAGHYERALALLRTTSDLTQRARTLNNLGVLQVARGEYDAALRYYRESLHVHETLGNTPNVATTLGNIGIVHRMQGDHAQALAYYQRSLAMSEGTGNRAEVAEMLQVIGVLYGAQGNSALAMEYYTKALAMTEALGSRFRSALIQTNIANQHLRRGDYDAARALYEQALHTREAIGDRAGVAETWTAIGGLYQEQGDLDRAVECFDKGLQIRQAVGDQRGVAESLTRLYYVYARQGHQARALELAERAVTMSRERGYRDRLWRALLGVGRAKRALGHRDGARDAFTEAIAIVESLREDTAGGDAERQRAFESQVAPYRDMVALLVEAGDAAAALLVAERAKARVLLDVLGQGRTRITKAMTADETHEERAIERELVALNAQIAYGSGKASAGAVDVGELRRRLQATQARREAFHAGLYAAHPNLAVQRRGPAPLTLAEADGLLPEAGAAILEYVVTEETTYVFVVRRAAAGAAGAAGVDVRVHAVAIARRDLAARTAALRDQLAARDPGFRDASAALFDLLVAPVSSSLGDARHVIVVPDASLWELPFQALWMREPGRYLIERHAISYAPSMTVLREMARLRRTRVDASGRPRLLAFANPATSTTGPLAALPHAETEVRRLATLYGPTQSRVYVGAAAREDRWKAEAGQFGVLHLAAHGLLDAASPMYSYLALAPSPAAPAGRAASTTGIAAADAIEDDGLLQAWELMALDLRAELVVLSGCETARGRVAAGEGVIGLSWALFVAGSPAAIVSLWKVESASTAQVMEAFHRQWRSPGQPIAGGAAKAEALQRAAFPLLRSVRYRHPFYWAGFVLIGDGS